jgi:hypothetical protein
MEDKINLYIIYICFFEVVVFRPKNDKSLRGWCDKNSINSSFLIYHLINTIFFQKIGFWFKNYNGDNFILLFYIFFYNNY